MSWCPTYPRFRPIFANWQASCPPITKSRLACVSRRCFRRWSSHDVPLLLQPPQLPQLHKAQRMRYRVRLGPYDNTDELNRIKGELGKGGFDVAVIRNP